MSSKGKKVTYMHPIDENTDYLVPLQTDYNSSTPIHIKLSGNPSSATPPSSFFGSINFPLSLLIYVGIPIAQLVIGFVYIGQCPVQEMIVNWMIVSGIAGIFLVVTGVIIHIQTRKPTQSVSPYDSSQSYSTMVRVLLPIFAFLLLFVIAWFFAGQVFIFEVKLRVEFFDSTLPEYCHGNLYRSAYILIFIDYIILLFGMMLNVLSLVAPADDQETKHPIQNPKI